MEEQGMGAKAISEFDAKRIQRRPYVKLYKAGYQMAIETNAQNEDRFIEGVAYTLGELIHNGAFERDWEFQLQHWLPQICDIVSKLRGYKANVQEDRVILAGSIPPGDTDLVASSLTRNGHFPSVSITVPLWTGGASKSEEMAD